MAGKFIKTNIYDYLREELSNVDDNFKRWFSGSKIIDNYGNPLVTYHGSSFDFNEFDGDSYFTDDYYNADGYANGEYVYEVFLKITNPIVIDCDGRKWDELETLYGTSTREVIGNIDRSIYDGVIFTNIKDNWIDDIDYQDSSVVYVTFNPNQIKSVENDGTWDIGDDNIFS